MIPILFEADASDFTTHGLGDLPECTECIATANTDGEYEMEFTYPIHGRLFEELETDRIVLAKANHYHPPQIFRIYGYEKNINGTVNVKCQHISYDLNRMPSYFTDTYHMADAFANLKYHCPINCPFNLLSDRYWGGYRDTTGDILKRRHLTPASIRSILLDGEDSFLGLVGGMIEFNNYDISIIGYDANFTRTRILPVVEYGQNMLDISFEKTIDDIYTGVFPFWQGKNPLLNGRQADAIVVGDVKYYDGVEGVMPSIQALDLSEYFSGQTFNTRMPTKEEVDEVCDLWMQHQIPYIPADISMTLEYADLKDQDIRMMEPLIVRFPKMKISVEAIVTGYTYDVLAERCTEVEIGTTKSSKLYNSMREKSLHSEDHKYEFRPEDSPYYEYNDEGEGE